MTTASGDGGNMRRVRAVVAVVLGAGLVAVLGGCADASEAKAEHRAWAFEGKRLTVDVDGARLRVVAADVEKVEVTRRIAGHVVLGKGPTSTWGLDGDRLRLRTSCAGVVADCDARYEVKVPRALALTVRGKDGGVSVSGFRTAVAARVDDGSLTVRDVSGPLDVRSADGSVDARGIGSRSVRMRSTDGSLHLVARTPPALVDTDSKDGSTTVEVPGSVRYDVRTEVRDGSTHVSVDRAKDGAHKVRARSVDGSVTIRAAG
ncbi:DUF4097 family beta strand repeat-containing protein [Streptomyces sp. NRRL F-5630]|uniref:DUF4097 family beta strand repeat-containing protein n=1 Tax=Streptomyces sp. NRRL F-5630 TaxID=1463864 RepID=UPI003D75B95A